MVTVLPSEIKGVDPHPGDSPDRSLTQLARTDVTSSPRALTDDEMAELLTSGDSHLIQAAMPRFSPQMRKLAEALLAESEK
jgi:hypothetical protein